MRVGDEELVDPVVFFGRRSLLAAPAALLGAVFGERLALDVAGVRKCDHHVSGRDQILGREVIGAVLHQAAARAQLGLTELVLDVRQLFADDGGDALRSRQDVQQIVNFGHHLFVFNNDLVLLQAGQALQAHLQDLLRLRLRQTVQAILTHAVFFFQTTGR